MQTRVLLVTLALVLTLAAVAPVDAAFRPPSGWQAKWREFTADAGRRVAHVANQVLAERGKTIEDIRLELPAIMAKARTTIHNELFEACQKDCQVDADAGKLAPTDGSCWTHCQLALRADGDLGLPASPAHISAWLALVQERVNPAETFFRSMQEHMKRRAVPLVDSLQDEFQRTTSAEVREATAHDDL